MTEPRSPDPRFPSTCWSRIAADDDGAGLERAMETLARAYWRPICAYLRGALRRSDEEARDLTQDFFVWMIETGFLRKADPGRGRFRAFLKTALRHYVTDRARAQAARKRGGGRRFVPLDEELGLPAAAGGAPDEILDAAWRAQVIRRALAGVQEEFEARGRGVVFAVFRDYFLDPDEGVDYRALAARHAITTTDVSNHLQRAKALYRERLRAELAETVATNADLEGELAWLLEPRR
jgi:RNA polymerase sigma-70 factor (ECF subfamily)